MYTKLRKKLTLFLQQALALTLNALALCPLIETNAQQSKVRENVEENKLKRDNF